MFLLLVLLSTSACMITVQARPQATDLSRLPPELRQKFVSRSALKQLDRRCLTGGWLPAYLCTPPPPTTLATTTTTSVPTTLATSMPTSVATTNSTTSVQPSQNLTTTSERPTTSPSAPSTTSTPTPTTFMTELPTTSEHLPTPDIDSEIFRPSSGSPLLSRLRPSPAAMTVLGDPEAQVEEDIASLAALAASLSEEQATSDATSVGTESTAGDAEATEAPEVAATEVVPPVPAGDGEQGSPAAPAEEAAEEVAEESSTIAPSNTEPPPEPELPTDEPEPTVAEPEPVVTEPEPTAAEPEPTVAEPEPEPTVVEAEPTVAEPEPTVAEPEPTVAEPEPTVAEPKLTVAESEAEPTVAEPEPTVAEPEPTVAEPEPTVAESEPTESPQPEEPEETSAVEELVTEAAPADKEDAEVPATSPTEGPDSEVVTPTVPQPLPDDAVSEPSVQLSPDSAGAAEPEDEAAEEIASSAVQGSSGAPDEAAKQQKTEDLALSEVTLLLPPNDAKMHVRPDAGAAGMDDGPATEAPTMDVDPTMEPKKMDADAAAAAPKGEEQVDLDDVYKQGVESHVGQSDVLTNTVEESMGSLFLDSRQVAYRLGRHKVSTYVTELKVTGIEDMRILEVSSDIEDMSLNVTFQFPEIRFSGKFNATGSIMDKQQHGVLVLRTPFPSYGHGNIQAVIANTTAVSQAELSHSFNDRKLSIELLTCHLTFGEPEVTLTDVKLPRALRKLHFERLFRVALAKMISHQLTAEVEPKVDESLHDVITTVLDRVSLDEDGAKDFVSLGGSPDAWKGAVRS